MEVDVEGIKKKNSAWKDIGVGIAINVISAVTIWFLGNNQVSNWIKQNIQASNKSAQEKTTVAIYTKLAEQGNYQLVIKNIDSTLQEGELYPATKSALLTIRKLSEDAVSMQTPSNDQKYITIPYKQPVQNPDNTK